MSDVSVPVLRFLFKKQWTVMEGALQVKPVYEVENLDSADDLSTMLSSLPSGLVVCSLEDKDDLIQIATALKSVKSMAKSTIYKFAVINFSGNKQFEKSLNKLGILDLIDPKVNQKALRFKMDFLVKAIKAQLKKAAAETPTKLKSSESNKAKIVAEEKAKAGVTWLEPLDCEDDIWWVRQDSDCKKVLTRWLLKIMGPSPNVAHWAEIPDQPGAWRFEIKPDFKEAFIHNEGSWYFRGTQKPDYIWQENLWLMTGEKYELFYQTIEKKELRLSYNDKIMSVARNSEYAKVKLQAIEDSFDRELVFRQEAEKKSEQVMEGEDGHLESKLEGENAEAEVLDGKMKGKASSAAEMDGQLSGEVTRGSGSDMPEEETRRSSQEEEHGGSLQGRVEGEESVAEARKKRDYSESALGSYLKNKDKKSSATLETDLDEETGDAESAGLNKAQKNSRSEGDTDRTSGPLQGRLKERSEGSPVVAEERDGAGEAESVARKDRSVRVAKAIAEHFPELAGKKLEELSPENLEKVRKKFQEKRLESLSGKSEAGTAERDPRKDPFQGETDQLEGKLSGSIDRGNSPEPDEQERKNRTKETGQTSAQSSLRGQTETSEDAPAWGEDFEGETDKLPGNLGGEIQSSGGGSKPRMPREAEEAAENDGAYRGGLKEQKAKSARTPFEGETDKLPGNLGGRSCEGEAASPASKDPFEGETDHFAGHLGGKSKIGQGGNRPGQDPFEGKTDQIAGHLGGKSRIGEGGNQRRGLGVDGDSFDGELFNLHSLDEARELREELREQADLGDCLEEIQLTALLTFKSVTYECQLNDAFDKTITFTCDQGGVTAGAEADLEIIIEYIGQTREVKCNGMVSGVEDDGAGIRFITLELSDESAGEIEGIIEVFQQRQQNVDIFMKQARGL